MAKPGHVVSSVPTILQAWVRIQAHHLHFFNLNCWNWICVCYWNKKGMKINKKRPGSAHLKINFSLSTISQPVSLIPSDFCAAAVLKNATLLNDWVPSPRLNNILRTSSFSIINSSFSMTQLSRFKTKKTADLAHHGQVVSVLAFYSDSPSSHPDYSYSFFFKMCAPKERK